MPNRQTSTSETIIQASTGEVEMMPEAIDYMDVDIVICLDTTDSMLMGDVIEMFKEKILSFYNDLNSNVGKIFPGREISSIRMKVIGFKDLRYDALPKNPNETWFNASNFFTIVDRCRVNQEKVRMLEDFLDNLEISGGGDEPESSLDALALAMNSDWREDGQHDGQHMRHMVVLMTDAPYKDLFNLMSLREEVREDIISRGTPDDMPSTLSELSDCWNCRNLYFSKNEREHGNYFMHPSYKRLCIFAPECDEWNEFCSGNDEFDTFEYTQYVTLEEKDGKYQLTWDNVMDMFARSMK